jgi:hypothetical protein
MAGFNGLKSAVVAMTALAIPVLTNGCSSNPVGGGGNPLCCTEFQAGATVSASIGGSAQSLIAVQAVADVAGIASASIDTLTTACRNIATDLNAAQADIDAANGSADKNSAMTAWCNLAVKQITAVKATVGANLTVTVTPPVCEASVSATLDCQAKCNANVKCDFKANPPKCTGGTLTIDCKGGCTASAGASVSCTGQCTGKCSGSCTAQGGVDCTGKCDGTCTAKAGVGTGTGAQADGTCQGTCSGTCSVTAPSATCSGTCSGSCDATCQGSATASVKCDGKCDADYQPVSCTGGKIEGGCSADAKCSGNCQASAQAKATCTPPQVEIKFDANANVQVAAQLEGTLRANLPLIFQLKGQFAAVGDAAATISGNITAVTDIKAVCIPAVIAAGAGAATDLAASVKAVGSLSGSVGVT